MTVIAIADAGRFADPDLWRHIIVGERIIAGHRIAFADPYSYSVFDHPWGNNSWLADVISALFYDGMGVVGLNVMKLICAAGLILLIAVAVAETGASRPLQFSILLVSSVTLGPFLEFRPQLYTFVLFAALLVLMTRHSCRDSAGLWMAIPVVALWANLHGGFVVGIAALGAYSCAYTIVDLAAGRGRRRGLQLAALTVGALAATLVTPYGIDSWYMVAHSLNSAEARGSINEWRPLLDAMVNQWHESGLTLIYYLPALGLMAVTAIFVVLAPDARELPLVAVAALMTVAAFTAVRNLPLAVIALIVPLGRHAGVFFGRRREDRELSAEKGTSPTNQAVLGIIALFILGDTGLFSRRLPVTIPYPNGAIAFMDSHSLKGNLLNDVNWGGYLLWHARSSKIFIDGRYETLYPPPFIRSYLEFVIGEPAGARLLDEYPHDFVLLPPGSGGARLTSARKQWTLIYRDPNAVLYARTGSRASRMAGVPIVSVEAPPFAFP